MTGLTVITTLVAFFALLTCAYLVLRIKQGQWGLDTLNKLNQDIVTA